MGIRVIDNKKVEITEDEFSLYKEICRSYDRPNFQGEDLFKNLFETNDDGIIIALKPPRTYTSMEVFMFLMSLMEHQHLRRMEKNINSIVEKLNIKLVEVDAKLKLLNEK